MRVPITVCAGLRLPRASAGCPRPQAERPAAQPRGVPRQRRAVRRVSLAVSEFGQLGARRHDPRTARTEIDEQGGVNLDAQDPAEAVRIVRNLIPHGELLGRRSGGWGAKGTSGQEAPGRGAGWFHHYQYAPVGSMRLPGRSHWVRRAGHATGGRHAGPVHGVTGLPPYLRIQISLDGGDDEGRPATRDDRQVMRARQVRQAEVALKIEHQGCESAPAWTQRSVYGPRLLASIAASLPALAELAAARAQIRFSAALSRYTPPNAAIRSSALCG